MSTHPAIVVAAPGVIEQTSVPTPAPAAGELLIEVKYSTLMPANVYQAYQGRHIPAPFPFILGFSIAGYVKAIGDGVTDLKEGDKVNAISFPGNKTASFQQFAIAPRVVVAKLPDDYDLAEASTFPDNYPTAIYTIFGKVNLDLPIPSTFPAPSPPDGADQPILVNGGAATSGQFIVQLFHLAGYTQIYATASPRNHAYLKELGAKQVFDYHSPRLAEEILEATGGKKIAIAVDTVSTIPGIKQYSPVLGKESRLAILVPIKKGNHLVDEADEGKDTDETLLSVVKEIVGEATVLPVGAMLGLMKDPLAPLLFPKILPQLLEHRALRPNRIHLFKESDGPLLGRVKTALELIRENKISGEKVVIELSWN